MEVPLGQAVRLVGRRVVGVERAGVDFGKRVVQRAAIAKGLMDRRVEAIENAELELIRAFEEILHI